MPDTPPLNHQKGHVDRFLVCGLGSLGQHCVVTLKRYGVLVSAVDLQENIDWEVDTLPDALENLFTGDCRHPQTLERARIKQYRSILLATSDDRINLEAAFQARMKNPDIRLVVRSAKQNLNELIRIQLGNFVALEPIRLSAPAFAMAAMGGQMISCFRLNPSDRFIQVLHRKIRKGDALIGRTLQDLNSRMGVPLVHYRIDESIPGGFYRWRPDTYVRAGDTVVYLSVTGHLRDNIQNIDMHHEKQLSEGDVKGEQGVGLGTFSGVYRRKLRRFFRNTVSDQAKRAAMICGATVVLLLLTGAGLFRFFGPSLSFEDALYATFVLLLGGYSDLLGSEFSFSIQMPWWLRFFGLMLTLSGTVFVGVLYAFLTQNLISARFKFKRNPPLPTQGHVVVIGLEMIGKEVSSLFQGFKQAHTGITFDATFPVQFQSVPVVDSTLEDMADTMENVHIKGARSVVALTDDEMNNLELALMAKRINPDIGLVIRTYHRRFSENISRLFSGAQVLCTAELAAEAFSAAAFGEKVPHLFRMGEQTILVTEYDIEEGDTLSGRILSEVSYGYGIVPIYHECLPRGLKELLPTIDRRLLPGDRLIVLATTRGLQRVERGEMLPKCCTVRINRALTYEACFGGANVLARYSGCSIEDARRIMDNLPADFPYPLYLHQGFLLVKALRRSMIDSELEIFQQ